MVMTWLRYQHTVFSKVLAVGAPAWNQSGAVSEITVSLLRGRYNNQHAMAPSADAPPVTDQIPFFETLRMSLLGYERTSSHPKLRSAYTPASDIPGKAGKV